MSTSLIVAALGGAVVLVAWLLAYVSDRGERVPDAGEVWQPMTTNPTWDHEMSCRCRLCRN